MILELMQQGTITNLSECCQGDLVIYDNLLFLVTDEDILVQLSNGVVIHPSRDDEVIEVTNQYKLIQA